MTREEFNNTSFTGGMKVKYKGRDRYIISIDFEEGLIGVDELNDGEVSWKRCEDCVLVYETIKIK